jgi:phospholipid/cholesterol/gamma-HCH transport system substrate-binding protein
MKVSNETKVGALTAIAITLLILGFNFLKGKKLFDKRDKLYAKFEKVEGLTLSNPVVVNGLQVGTVSEIRELDKDLRYILVAISLNKEINLPRNSHATIASSLLGTTSVNIEKGTDNIFLKNNDTLLTTASLGLMGEAKQILNPVLDKVKGSLDTLTFLLSDISKIFDPNTKNNIREIIGNINVTTANLTRSSASLEGLMNTQTGDLAKSLKNVNDFTGNLAKNNEKVTQVMTNVEKTTAQLANAKIDETMAKLGESITEMKNLMAKLNSNDGSLGLLMNDKKLYNNLASTTRSLNTLFDDLRLHPKRYIHFSVFGKKDKKQPLMAPLADSLRQDNN